MSNVRINKTHFDVPSVSKDGVHYFPYPKDVKIVDGKLAIAIASYQGKWRCDTGYLVNAETITAIFDRAVKGGLITEYPAVVNQFLQENAA